MMGLEKMKKNFSVYLSKAVQLFIACVMFLFVLGIQVDAATDTTAPMIKRLRVDTTQVEGSATIKLTVDVAEEETGVDMIGVHLFTSGGKYIQVFKSVYDSERYTGTIQMEGLPASSCIAGDYYINSVDITDQAGNMRRYVVNRGTTSSTAGCSSYLTDASGMYLIEDTGTEKCYLSNGGAVKVINNITLPELAMFHEIECLNPTVEKGGILNFNVTASYGSKMLTSGDSVPQISLELWSYNKNTSVTSIGLTILGVSWVSEGVFSVRCKLDEAIPSGTYYIGRVRTYHLTWGLERYYYAGTSGYYKNGTNVCLKEENSANVCNVKGNSTITVLSDGYEVVGDNDAPKLKSINFREVSMTKPGVIHIDFSAYDASTIRRISVTMVNGSGGWLSGSRTFYQSATELTGTLEVPVSTSTINGPYYIQTVQLHDSKGNYETYWNTSSSQFCNAQDGNGAYITSSGNSGSVENVYFKANSVTNVEDEFNIAFESALSNSKLLTKIKNMSEGSTARIKIDNNQKASKELFEAIKGKNKTLIFSSDLYQWVFNGKNITNPKDINLNVYISVASGADYGISEKVLKMQFANNGKLPGVANIRIKSDYISSLFGITGSVYLYHLESDGKEDGSTFEVQIETASNIKHVIDDANHWCYFDIDHNSSFIASGRKIDTGKMSAKVGTTFKSTKYNCTYKVTERGAVTVQKVNKKSIKSATIPNTIKYKGVTYKVTSIAKNAFSNCTKLKKVTIGKNVTNIGEKAFYGCTSLSAVSIPAAVTSIGKSAFERCKNLKSITIPANVKTIGSSAFKNCSALKKVKMGKGLKKIAANTFYGCKKLSSVAIGSQVSSIGDKAFYGCSSLKSITIPSKVDTLGTSAFQNCKKLKNITIKSSSLKKAGKNVFKGIGKKAVMRVPKTEKKNYNKLLNCKKLGISVKAL